MRTNLRRRPQRAVALLTAMVVCFFLLVLTGALIQTQSGAFAISQSSDSRVRARAACATLYDYCRYQVEHNRDWGKGGFAGVGDVDPPRTGDTTGITLDTRIEVTEVDGARFHGYLSEHGTSFEVEVVNSLTNSGSTSSLSGLVTPPEHLRLIITAWDGKSKTPSRGSRQQVDCLMRLAPLYDASVLTRGNMSVDSDEVLFASKDPFRNEARAEGDINMPGLTDGKTRFIKHDSQVLEENADLADMTPDHNGMLWSGDNIKQDGNGTALDAAGLLQATEKTGGRMVSQASTRADIYDLKPENIPKPAVPPDRDIRVPPGEFRFTRASALVDYEIMVPNYNGDGGKHPEARRDTQNIDVVEYYDPPGSTVPLKVLRRQHQTPSESNPDDITVKSVDIDYGPEVSDDVPVVVGDKFYLDSDKFTNSITVADPQGGNNQVPEMGFRVAENGGSGPVAIDLKNQTLIVEPNTRVSPTSRAEGSTLPPSAFELTVKTGPGGEPERPTFQLGDGGTDVVLQADGDISIGSGNTKGLGTIISKQGDVTLQPVSQQWKWVQKNFNGFTYWVPEMTSGGMDVNANSAYAGLVIYAGKDVNISNVSDGDWTFRGFVYARGSFNFDVNDQNALFYGSVVAGNNPLDPGDFSITNGKRSAFIYDPDYLKTLTRQLPGTWTRVEPLVWSEGNG